MTDRTTSSGTTADGYVLGVDLGTTFTAAAVASGGAAEIVSLGHTTAVVPSVIVVRERGDVLVGEAAVRRAEAEPTRTAREFKRRLGDPVPYVLGGTPFGAEALTSHLLRHVYDTVVEQRGAPPREVVVTHPANYGDYKLDLVREAVRQAEVPNATLLSEPAAAATHYAEQDRLEVGDVVAVYDFGGGTFDAAVVEVTNDGHRIIGRPEGMERLGGIDFDQAVYAHVMSSLGPVADDLDATDPAVAAGLARLREACRTAKEALSSDTDVDIPVLLPNLHTQVRLTRTEFEAMIRPRIAETIESLERAIASADRRPDEVARVLLVGGSSRIPLVAEMVGIAVGRPVALDAHPKHAIALGAALHAAGPPPDPSLSAASVAATAAAPLTAGAAAGTTLPPPPAASDASTDRRSGPSRTVLAVAAVIALVAVIAGVVVFTSGGDDADEATPPASTEPDGSDGGGSDGATSIGSEPSPTEPVATDATVQTDPSVATDVPAATDPPVETDPPDDVIITAGEIILEPLADEPDDSFTDSVAAEPTTDLLAFASAGGATEAIVAGADPLASDGDPPATTPPTTPAPATTTAPDGAGPTTLLTVTGTAPGVYGGTRDEATCDPDLLVAALAARPEEAAAWAAVHEIEVDGIAEYVDLLTALNLTVDTRVTNHGYFEGEAIPRQSVLQVGTAVLVDEFGTPRVRCSSGSPLLPPEAVEGTTAYRGPAWETFDPATTAAVAPAPEPVIEFEVLNVAGGDGFIRIVGSSGGDDRDLLPGEIVATGALDFPTEGFEFTTNTMEITFSPLGGPVTGVFEYSISVQGVSIEGSGELTGDFDADALTITGTGFGTVNAGGFGGSGEGSWTAFVEPEAGLLLGVTGEGDGSFELTFDPYEPPR